MSRNNNSFDPNMMDVLINDADQVHEVAVKIKEDKKLISKNESVDVERVYGELSTLISTGNEIIKNAKYAVDMDPTAEGVLAGTASMMNSVKDTIKEFTKIHLQNIKFEQQMQLEKVKQEGREKLVELRKIDADVEDLTHLVPFNQEDIIRDIINSED